MLELAKDKDERKAHYLCMGRILLKIKTSLKITIPYIFGGVFDRGYDGDKLFDFMDT